MKDMLKLVLLFCMFGVLEVSGKRLQETKENGGELHILLARIESLEKQQEESNTMKKQLEDLKEESSYMKQQLKEYREESSYMKQQLKEYKEASSSMKQQQEELKFVKGLQQKRIEDLETLLQGEKKDKEINGDGDEASMEQTRALGRQETRGLGASPSVSFFATLNGMLYHMGADQQITFENVVSNDGHAYNPNTGVFTAPVTGTYLFSTTVTADARIVTHAGFALNGVRITAMNINGAEKMFDSASDTILLQLNQGDIVTVINIDADASMYGKSHTIFSGFLLYQ